MSELPFDGEISRYAREGAPEAVRKEIAANDKGEILSTDYPYDKRWKRKEYEAALKACQVELVKLQHWLKGNGERIVLVFEGRDAAGKGGTVKRFRENMNPRTANVVALSKPSETEGSQWYFQRYIDHLPAGGHMVMFDRSWYNRGVVEKVFGFCDDDQREQWFRQVRPFEEMLVDEGIHLIKLWLNVDRAAQLSRFIAREGDPLKQWKLSPIDVEGLKKWDDYTTAIHETLHRTHSTTAPWTVIRSDDKRRARVNAIRHVLHAIDYARKDTSRIGEIDPSITGGPEMLPGR